MIGIKNVSIPKNCSECFCLVTSDGQELICPFAQDIIMDSYTTSRADWCPLIELHEVRNKEDRNWIPIDKDNIPECEVLCCDKSNEQMVGYVFFDENSDTQYSAENAGEYMYNCVAWMPLPKGYNKTKSEKAFIKEFEEKILNQLPEYVGV